MAVDRSLRDVVGNYMLKLAEIDDKVVVVNADLSGTCRTREFVKKYPDRVFNVGIAEQNMVSFSAGLAYEGFVPYAFSMASFISMRACEQCRTDVAYGNLPVRLIATYSGCSGGISGPTHWALEDCGIMCSIPNMSVFEPCDAIQVERILDFSLSYKKPMYIRTSILRTKDIYHDNYSFVYGKANVPREGKDASFICSGIIVQYAIEASNLLKTNFGVDIKVIDMHTLKPIDKNVIVEAARIGPVLVAQDHNTIGGLGSQVAKVIAEAGISTKFEILGVTDRFIPCAHAEYLYGLFNYDVIGLYKNMAKLLEL